MNLKHLNSYFSLSRGEKKLFFEAVFSQYWCKFLLLILPFRTILKRFSNPEPPTKKAEPRLIENIRMATAQANLLAFWKNRCLVQSLAARRMLHRRKIHNTLHFGMISGPKGKFIAHAWLQVDDIEVVNKGNVDVTIIEL